MAYVTLDDYLDEVGELVELAEELEPLTSGEVSLRVKMLLLGLKRVEAQLSAGASSRRKLRDHKARRALQAPTGQVPIEFPS